MIVMTLFPRAVVAAAALLLSFPAAAAKWSVIVEQSRIGFSGTHAGAAFEGRFETWSADIAFDPDALADAEVTVRVDLTSAATGNVTYDKSLPTADWLDVNTSQTATFRTTSIRKSDAGGYLADGTLSLRGKDVPVTLAFDLEINGDTATMTGRSTLARLDFSIGAASDAGGAWVSLEIPVDIKVVAKRTP